MQTAKYWLLLEKSDETRISKGIDGYSDRTGESYRYDSLVPNHKRLAKGDGVVLRKEDQILGVGRVSGIEEYSDTKIHRRCPQCKSTDIRERIKLSPKWKCGKCAHEFTEPKETITAVQSYTASIEGFSQLNFPPSVREAKLCAVRGDGASSQLSILELDEGKLVNLLEGIRVSPSPTASMRATAGQGFGLSTDERRAIELSAMRVAIKLYKDEGWDVVDKSSSHPFDLLASRGNAIRFIEVKGTTGDGHSIILTHGEVAHARSHLNESALVVVSNFTLAREDGHWVALGGSISLHLDPWCIVDSCLQATEFRYALRKA